MKSAALFLLGTLVQAQSFETGFSMAEAAPPQVPAPVANPTGIEITVNHQPAEVLQAVALSRLKGVGLYSASICNRGNFNRDLSGNDVRAAIGKKMDVVAWSLTSATFRRSREKSKRYWIIRSSEIALMGLNAAIASDLVRVGSAIRGATATTLPIVDRLAHWLDNSGSSPEQIGPWIEPDRIYLLAPGRCSSGLFLGAWPTRTPLSVEIR